MRVRHLGLFVGQRDSRLQQAYLVLTVVHGVAEDDGVATVLRLRMARAIFLRLFIYLFNFGDALLHVEHGNLLQHFRGGAALAVSDCLLGALGLVALRQIDVRMRSMEIIMVVMDEFALDHELG